MVRVYWLGRCRVDGVCDGLIDWEAAGYLCAEQGDLLIVIYEGENNEEEAGWLYGTMVHKHRRGCGTVQGGDRKLDT